MKEKDPHQNQNSLEFMEWKRLQLSKAKLSTITEIAALMAGFAVVATVELQINDDPNPYLLSAFTVVTSLLVCTTMMALLISTCMLPYIQVVSKIGGSAKESPHEDMAWFVNVSWVLANCVSIFLFTLDAILLCWIKFTHFSLAASICATVILGAVLLIIIAFGIVFYRILIQHQYEVLNDKCQQLDEMCKNIEREQSNISFIQHV